MTMAHTATAAQTSTPAVVTLAPKADQESKWIAHRDPISFDAAIREVLGAAEKDGARADKMADLVAWGFGSTDNKHMQIAQMVGGQSLPLTLRKNALRQLAARCKVPMEYLLTLPAKLQIACMNWGMSTQQERAPALLRLAGNEVRAIVSDRYAAFDDSDMLEIVDEALHGAGFRADAMVRSTTVGQHTNLRITIPSGAVEVKAGDLIEWGVDITNSELGLRSVQIVPMTYRLVCTNGMRSANRAGATARLAHRGDALSLREKIKVSVPTAFAEARGDMAMWKKSVNQLIDNALDEIDGLRGFGLTVGETQAIARRLDFVSPHATQEELAKSLKGARTSVFDLANAITETARDRADVAGRLSLEETAHAYLMRRAG